MTNGDASQPSRARRGGAQHRGTPPEPERLRLARDLGGAMRSECVRAGVGVRTLPARTGLSRTMIDDLLAGRRRPSTTTCWRIGLALARAQGYGDEMAAAIAARLVDAAGSSIRDYSKRSRARRTALIAKARRAAGPSGVPVGPGDTPASVAAHALERLLRADRDASP
ncbi:hypothetical protein [Pseudonocardia alni]|uniref:hypothetical protein n=1 Tax=Pseudonocardia alni TaxID=33907 RepID=UPI00331B589D